MFVQNNNISPLQYAWVFDTIDKNMAGALAWVLQRNVTDRDTYREIYYKELAHTVMEAERLREMQLASWRPRKAGGVSASLR